jgi:hypothetical protein
VRYVIRNDVNLFGIVIIKGSEILGKCFSHDKLGTAYLELVVSVSEGKFPEKITI